MKMKNQIFNKRISLEKEIKESENNQISDNN